MSTGRESLHQIHVALDDLEKTIVAREHRGPLGSRVPLQQEVNRAREVVVTVVARLVAEARLEGPTVPE